jgi:hypothetical protein
MAIVSIDFRFSTHPFVAHLSRTGKGAELHNSQIRSPSWLKPDQ